MFIQLAHRVATKVKQLLKEFSNLDRYPKAKSGATFMKKEANFVENGYLI